MEADMETLERLTVTVLAEDSVGYETPYLGQHGVSFYLQGVAVGAAAPGAPRASAPAADEAARAEPGSARNILVDVAQHPDPLLFNMDRMGIDPASIDAIVLTHCHYDHTQGLARVVKEIGKTDLPIVAHPDIFRTTFITAPYLRHVGVPASDSREKVEAAGGRFFLSSAPLGLMPGLTTSGEIERTTDYEAVEMGLGTIRDDRPEVDDVRDDISVFALTERSGAVVVTGCSHAGIVNICRTGKALTGAREVGVVIGGLHLIEASAERITRTAADLKVEGVARIAAGHCTGFPAQVELQSVFGDRFSPLRTGDVFEL
jgi:7,8-dihydropterin-6-yl-methyl-4-(beta-D-ribofuranosyl)aminobenzene 5'-phosphate synthase